MVVLVRLGEIWRFVVCNYG